MRHVATAGTQAPGKWQSVPRSWPAIPHPNVGGAYANQCGWCLLKPHQELATRPSRYAWGIGKKTGPRNRDKEGQGALARHTLPCTWQATYPQVLGGLSAPASGRAGPEPIFPPCSWHAEAEPPPPPPPRGGPGGGHPPPFFPSLWSHQPPCLSAAGLCACTRAAGYAGFLALFCGCTGLSPRLRPRDRPARACSCGMRRLYHGSHPVPLSHSSPHANACHFAACIYYFVSRDMAPLQSMNSDQPVHAHGRL